MFFDPSIFKDGLHMTNKQPCMVICGATGLLGKPLTLCLLRLGFKVYALGRDAKKLDNAFVKKPNLILSVLGKTNIDEPAIIINLAGENLGQKFIGQKRLQELCASRTECIKKLKECCTQPLHFYQASAMAACSMDKDDPFLKLCLAIESKAFETFDCATALRFGIILDKKAPFCAIFKTLPRLYVMGADHRVPTVNLSSLVDVMAKIIEEDLTVLRQGQKLRSSLDLYDKALKLNELLYSLHPSPLAVPVPAFCLKIGDKRGLLLSNEYDLSLGHNPLMP